MTGWDLVVLGDANPDLVLRGGGIVPAFGQAEHVVDDASLVVGGSGAILACGASQLGLRVAIVGLVGDDLFGTFIRSELEAHGVDCRWLVVDPGGRATGVTVVLSGTTDRAILTSPGTIAALTPDMVPAEALASARHVHVSSYFLQSALAPGLPAILERARGDGASTSLDPNWDPSERWDGELRAMLAHLDVFLPNDVEAMRLARISDLREAIARLSEARMVVVKRGASGAMAGSGGEVVAVPALVVEVVDTTGAGDSFDAGFLVAFLNGWDMKRALAFANVCGALSTSRPGGVEGQATMEEALALLDAQGGAA